MTVREKILKDLGLNPAKKTLLYGPTFYPSSFESFGMKLPEMSKNLNLIIKLHQWSYFMEKFSGVNLRRHVKLAAKIRKQYPQVAIIEPEHYNIIDLYQAADVLLTEPLRRSMNLWLSANMLSSVIFIKKIGTLSNPGRIFRRRLDEDMYTNMTNFCYHIKPQKNYRRHWINVLIFRILLSHS
jgi:hypothetical protein